MSKYSKYVADNQFENVNEVLRADNDQKERREKEDVITWLTSHDHAQGVTATSYQDIKRHRGVIDANESKPAKYEYSYESAHLQIKKDANLDAIADEVKDAVKDFRSLVAVNKDIYGGKDDKYYPYSHEIVVVVQLDRRVRTGVITQVNQHFAKYLKQRLHDGGRRSDKNHRPLYTMDSILAVEYDRKVQYPSGLNGCKDGAYTVSDSQKPYVIKTDCMMKYLEGIKADPSTSKLWTKHILGKPVTNKQTGLSEFRWSPKSQTNANLAIVNQLPGLLKYDQMLEMPVITRTIYDRDHANRIPAGVLSDESITGLQLWCEYGPQQSLIMTSKQITALAEAISMRNSYDSFFDYLESIPQWDGKKRLERMFIDSLGADDNPMTRYLGLVTTVGMIYLAAHPGDKLDVVIDLVGEQGTGKTTMIQKLANSFGTRQNATGMYGWDRPNLGWYTQGFTSFSNKDGQMQMAGKLFINDDELVASSRTDPETLKEFASTTELAFRPPYGRNMRYVPRRFMLYRTTNRMDLYLSKIGQRKFWPIVVNKDRIKTPVVGLDAVWTPAYVDMLWAEAWYLYQTKGTKWVSKLLSAGNQRKFAKYRDIAHTRLQKTDDVTIQVVGYIYDKLSDMKPGKKLYISTQEILTETGINAGINDRKITAKIRAIMMNDLKCDIARPLYNGKRASGYKTTPASRQAVADAAQAYGALDADEGQDQGDADSDEEASLD